MMTVAVIAFVCVLCIGGSFCLLRPTAVLGWYERALRTEERLSDERLRKLRASRAYTLNVQVTGIIALLMGAVMVWAVLVGARP
jgi:hypothetical protein